METIKHSRVVKLAEARGKSMEDATADHLISVHPPGFQDFTSSAVEKKKRNLPIAPRRKPQNNTNLELDGEEN